MYNMRSTIKKGSWTDEEDNLLRKCIDKHGEGNWHRVPQRAGLSRCRKSCRLRWLNYLKPNIKRGQFSEDEVDLIIRLHKLLGNRWSLIAGRIPGRTANDVKNYWNTHLHKKWSPNHIVSRPQPCTLPKLASSLVMNKPDPLSISESNVLDNGPIDQDEDDRWEKLVQGNEEGVGVEQLSYQKPINQDGLNMWPTSTIEISRSPITRLQQHNLWEADNLWNFDLNDEWQMKPLTPIYTNPMEYSRSGTFWNALDITTPETSRMFQTLLETSTMYMNVPDSSRPFYTLLEYSGMFYTLPESSMTL
ncbi:hypothetical protein KSS87_000983 [Heliosperma pusillum]|nr:hypothetical protein KSS87_000983 [Heliosperma pusillum]